MHEVRTVTKRSRKKRNGRARVLDREEIARLHNDGLKAKEIAATLECNCSTVLRILSELNETEDFGSGQLGRSRCIEQDAKFCAAMQTAIDQGLERP